ncbi:MAG: dTMP kinase [Candidatus Aenigmarchaeota archaeon ex4484_14]|nr:MAG: dTMP kinase [Candidatus Aenigmarchaeota archaeon ex4484_14]
MRTETEETPKNKKGLFIAFEGIDGSGQTTQSTTALQLLFTADRSQHLTNVIEPALKSGKTIVCDRYLLSTIAFGSIAADMDYLKSINAKFRRPDITFILNVPPEACMKRIRMSRPSTELFEEEEKLKKIREAYFSLKDYLPNTYVIDGIVIMSVVKDIKNLKIQGATDIALKSLNYLKRFVGKKDFNKKCTLLLNARPTAVTLYNVLKELKKTPTKKKINELVKALNESLFFWLTAQPAWPCRLLLSRCLI